MGPPKTPLTIAYTTLSVLSILAALIPAAWHKRAHNTPGLCLIGWIVTSNLINVVNALIWGSGDINTAWDGRILCDIEVKLLAGTGTGMIAAALAIARKVAHATGRIGGGSSGLSARQRKIVDLIICLVPPFLMILLHYLVQPNRYNLIEISGCSATSDETWLAVLVLYIGTPLLSIIASVYCVITLIRIIMHRREMARILSSNGSGLTQAKFARLVGFTFLIVFLTTPVAFYVFSANIGHDIKAYSFKYTHSGNWDWVNRYETNGAIMFDRWVPIAGGFFNFIFFGTGKDAMGCYKDMLKRMGIRAPSGLFKRRKEVLPLNTMSSAASYSDSSLDEKAQKGKEARLNTYLRALPPVFVRRFNPRADPALFGRSESTRNIVLQPEDDLYLHTFE